MPLTQRILSTTVVGLLLCTLAVLGVQPVQAAHNTTLTITTADWNAQSGTLTLKGRGERNFPVVATNASTPFQGLGQDTPGNNRRWEIVNTDPTLGGQLPFPCRVHVEQDDGVEVGVVEADVINAPPECSAGLPPICQINTPQTDVTILVGESVDYTGTATDPDGTVEAWEWIIQGGLPGGSTLVSTVEDPGLVTYDTAGSYTTSFNATDNDGLNCMPPASRTITVNDPAAPVALPNQTDYKFAGMNYELGMHCTGFEFAYCCVLPAYNSILTQLVKPQNGIDFPHLLEADPNNNVPSILNGGTGDVLERHTVVRDKELDANGDFRKYVIRYWHDAQPRNDGNGKPQSSTEIKFVEGNSLLAWNTIYDANAQNPDGTFVLGTYNGATNVPLGDGSLLTKDVFFTQGLFPGGNGNGFDVIVDNYQNGVWNHLYIYSDTEGTGGIPGGDRPDAAKLNLGLDVGYPTNFSPGGDGMTGLLRFSGETGTVVYTQMKVLEDLPIMLTSPNMWEALGLPLTPFEDSIDFFTDPGLVDEDSVRPYVQMKAQLLEADCTGGVCTEGDAVLDSGGEPVIGFGTAPIDIPNCERCHSAFNTVTNPAPNSPNGDPLLDPNAALVQAEIDFWKAYYPTMQTGSDWYARLKGAAISILSLHDAEHGTAFTQYYPGVTCIDPQDCAGGPLNPPEPGSIGALLISEAGAGDTRNLPQNTRLGHESVICQKCHADNVIAVVKSANCGPGSISCADGDLIPPITEAIHWNHREISEGTGGVIDFTDSLGRSGGCQGCHPAHRSDGDMSGYPITLDGNNFYADSDNRDANGGCFVGRDVHSNPAKDIDGAETPSHLNAVGEWLQANVANDSGSWKGIWCTNCHSQASQEIWKAENVADLVNAQPGDPGHVREPVAGAGLSDVVAAVNASLGTNYSDSLFMEWLDPADPAKHPGRTSDQTSAIWAPDPGLCDYVSRYVGLIPGGVTPEHDATVAVVEVVIGPPLGAVCVNGAPSVDVDCGPVNGGAQFQICGSTDTDGDFNVAVVGNTEPDNGLLGGVFCTTPDCVASANQALVDAGGKACTLAPGDNCAVPVPFSAATDGRDHWLAAGEPHCADCHAAPYVEQSGNISGYPPFNYPRKASLMRYTRGHSDITCQGCHESIHGLYPVTPTIDTTSYQQAASLNPGDIDDPNTSHGPIVCGACHDVGSTGVPVWMRDMEYLGQPIGDDFDAAVSWMHTFTAEGDPLLEGGVCQNCHGDRSGQIPNLSKRYLEHAKRGRSSRDSMDKVEIATFGHVAGDPDFVDPLGAPGPGGAGICLGCHNDRSSKVNCGNTKWKNHLIEGRVAENVWEYVSETLTPSNTTCGW